MSDTRTLARFASTLALEDVPGPVLDRARIVLLDGLGCLLAGTAGRIGQGIARTLGAVAGAPEASMFASGEQTSTRDAALANAVALYSVGLNDIHKPSGTHPGGCIIPVVIALGERYDAPGADLLAAMIAGYEVNGRIGMAVKASHRARGFHPTGTCGSFGAAAAAGRLAGLDPDSMANVLGIAGSQASGLYEFHHTGSTTMIYHAGRAAQNGVEALMMADAGFTGPQTVLEGRQGFYAAMADGADRAAIIAGLGETFMVAGTSLRPHFGCNSTKGVSSALARLIRAGDCPVADIAAIEIAVHPIPARDNDIAVADTLLAARLSLQYNAALVLARGDVLVRDLAEADLGDPAILAHMPRIAIVADESLSRYGCAITVTLASGQTRFAGDEGTHGDPANPLSWDDAVAKFHALTAGLVAPVPAERLIAAVAGLERETGRSLSAALADALGVDQTGSRAGVM